MQAQAQQVQQELNSSRVHVQAQQTALDAAAREISAAQEAAKIARAEAKKSGEEAAELRGALAAAAKSAPAPAVNQPKNQRQLKPKTMKNGEKGALTN